ncbi:GDSL-type esterase/lipase family protein [Microbispora sp. NPDC049125]|uniref:GDSL-type esterase/lipase family protein n=1 Tax=Microbispora sp. NPDC049125 TaxID=3154929 RepID=UPI0034659530
MTDVWTTAYLAALADVDAGFAFVPQPRDLSGCTVRQAVRLRRGGTAIRLVLSNEYGRTPLVIDGVTAGGGTSVVPVLRDGHGRWEIPPGQTATSDPVSLTTTAGDELVISCYVAGRAPEATYLHSAQRTGEDAPGDQLGRAQLTGATPFPSLHWITRVLVDTPASGPVIVALGDSITRGDCTTADLDQRYPDHLQRRLHAAGAGDAVVLNAGIGGNRLTRPGYGPSMTSRFARDVLAVTEATHVIIMGGVNDIGMAAAAGQRPPAAEDILQDLLALASRAHRHGIVPILGTITPFGGCVYEGFQADGTEEVRQAVNHALRTQRDWLFADFAAKVGAAGDPTRMDPAFDSGDGLHPGDAGAQALAEAIDPAMFTVGPPPRQARAL